MNTLCALRNTLLAGLLLWGPLLAGDALAGSIHRKGCSFPMERVEVCWEATGEEGGEYGPFPEVHLLPVAWERDGQPEVLQDYTRTIYRQILPGNLTDEIVAEWAPSLNLEETMRIVRRNDWPATLWIAPRRLHDSSSTSAGVVDWDVYFFKGTKPLRTMRIRVESKPDRDGDGFERALAVGAALGASGATGNIPAVATLASLGGAMAMGSPGAPAAGYSLEIMTELAVRQVMHLFQYALEELSPPPVRDDRPLSPQRWQRKTSDWWARIMTPK